MVLNRWGRDKIGQPFECAIMRHAFGCLYRDLTLMDTAQSNFVHQRTFLRMIKNFRNAVMRYGERIRRFHAARMHTNKKSMLSKHAREAHKQVIMIGDDSATYRISPALLAAVARAEAAATNTAAAGRNAP